MRFNSQTQDDIMLKEFTDLCCTVIANFSAKDTICVAGLTVLKRSNESVVNDHNKLIRTCSEQSVRTAFYCIKNSGYGCRNRERCKAKCTWVDSSLERSGSTSYRWPIHCR